MSNKDLFKEAIADAKAVREAALANAKVALEEALAPRLQNMISAKLQEMDSDEELDEAKDKEELDEMEFSNAGSEDPGRKFARERHASLEEGDEEELEEDFDLSEILAELEADELDEAKKKKKEDDEKDLNEAEEGEEEEEEEEEGEEEEIDTEEPEIEDAPEETSDEKLTDLTVDELKDIIKDIISAEMGGADMGGGDELNMDMGDMGGEEGGDEIAVDEEMYEGGDDEMDEELDLEELLAELDALDESDDEDLNEIKRKEAKKKEDKKKEDDKKEMNEAIATINTLRAELNEVNLLNAKLLYVNKIFKAKNLNESQKLKVIAQFDKATTAREAKTIYESMSTAIAATATKKSSLKESIGFASKAAGVAPKKNIVEVDETMNRWQMLAGIKKF